MLKTIIRKELLENIFSFRFPLFAVLCLVLIPLGMYVNQAHLEKKIRDYQEQDRLAADAFTKITMADVMAGKVAVRAFRPPVRLSVFAQGFESVLPQYYEFTQDGFTPGEAASGDESLASAQGKIDFVFLVQMVLSLIALLFASDVIAGEKEAGTLRAILANNLPRDSVLFGKIWGGFLALWGPFTVAFLLGLIVLLAVGFPVFGGNSPVRILTLFFAASFFLLVYFVIGCMISSSFGKSRTALVVILLVWVSFQLIVPKLGDMIADLVRPIRTETEVSLAKSLLAKSLDDEMARELGRQYTLLFPNGESIPKKGAPPTPEQTKWSALEPEIEKNARSNKARQLGRIDETYRQEKRTRNSLASNLSVLSPSAAFGRLLADICGTGEIERTKYMEAVQAYQGTLEKAVFSKVTKRVMILPGGGTRMNFATDREALKAQPKFSISSATPGEAFSSNLSSLASLLFWLIASFAAAYIRFRTYDVR
ncbi:MAG: ABC transporter permease subunit [Candidatus Aminicenantes bacterium]|nr:ABC transporter permease subunit [Candidatus Aminicenantes bacterium]